MGGGSVISKSHHSKASWESGNPSLASKMAVVPAGIGMREILLIFNTFFVVFDNLKQEPSLLCVKVCFNQSTAKSKGNGRENAYTNQRGSEQSWLTNEFCEEGSSQHFKVTTLSKHTTAHHSDLHMCACCCSLCTVYFHNDRVFSVDFFAC